MKIYRLTREGKKFVRVPRQNREEILDYLYQYKTAPLDELLTVDKNANSKLRTFERKLGYVEAIDGI